MANPPPTGTFTLQDTPNLAWRETGLRLTRFQRVLPSGWVYPSVLKKEKSYFPNSLLKNSLSPFRV